MLANFGKILCSFDIKSILKDREFFNPYINSTNLIHSKFILNCCQKSALIDVTFFRSLRREHD
jgi:hypothetical protein